MPRVIILAAWKCDKSYFSKCFFLENTLKYFFIFYNLFLISAYQNNLKIYKKLKKYQNFKKHKWTAVPNLPAIEFIEPHDQEWWGWLKPRTKLKSKLNLITWEKWNHSPLYFNHTMIKTWTGAQQRAVGPMCK
jgi:hypothetical protein